MICPRHEYGINQLSLETLWRIFQYLESPKYVFKVIASVNHQFHSAVYSRAIPLLVNVEIMCDAMDDQSQNSTLIQLPDTIKVLPEFNVIKVPTVPIRNEISSVESSKSNDPPLIYHSVGFERLIRLHADAITQQPEHLVLYMEQLLKKGLVRKSLSFRVIFGTIQIMGKRNYLNRDDYLAGFLGFLRPQSISLWSWDTDLIREIAKVARPPSLRLPNMKNDGHVTIEDFASLASMNCLSRLELFRPFPRQPWGIESNAFSILNTLPKLKQIYIQSGRLIHRVEDFTEAILNIPKLEYLNMTAWTLGIQPSIKILLKLRNLKSIQFIHVTSPDFWISLPSYYFPDVSVNRHSGICNSLAICLSHIGLHYMQPESADFAMMVQGLIRCMPHLHTLTVRISRPIDSEYDMFSISRDTLQRILRRLEEKTDLRLLVFEIGSRMWASRRSYADELVHHFAAGKMKVQFASPLVVG